MTGRDWSPRLRGEIYCVPAAVARAYWQGLQDEDERFAPSRLGIFVLPRRRLHEDDWGDEGDPAPSAGHRLFTRLMPRPATPAVVLEYDDIPF